jgi:hypothetical protein
MEFKKMYMDYRTDGDGWTDDYWEHFYEHKKGAQYFFTEPETPEHNRMYISSSRASVHLFFMTSDSEERLFDYPGKE